MERAQGLHEAIGTIASFSLTYRRIQYNHEMVLTKHFLVELCQRLREFEAILEKLWVACVVKKNVIRTVRLKAFLSST
jgi:hypothetical protein